MPDNSDDATVVVLFELSVWRSYEMHSGARVCDTHPSVRLEQPMHPQSLEQRVESLEQRVTRLEELPGSVDALGVQISLLRDEMRAEFSATRAELRSEMRAGDEDVKATLREEIRAGDERVMQTLRGEIRDSCDKVVRTLREEARAGEERILAQMRMLHEDVIGRLKLIEEGRPPSRKRPPRR